MGGKGELVLYKRIRARTKKQRAKLKKDIREIIDGALTPISIIALVEEEEEGQEGQEGQQSSSKRKRSKRKRTTRRSRKAYRPLG